MKRAARSPKRRALGTPARGSAERIVDVVDPGSPVGGIPSTSASKRSRRPTSSPASSSTSADLQRWPGEHRGHDGGTDAGPWGGSPDQPPQAPRLDRPGRPSWRPTTPSASSTDALPYLAGSFSLGSRATAFRTALFPAAFAPAARWRSPRFVRLDRVDRQGELVGDLLVRWTSASIRDLVGGAQARRAATLLAGAGLAAMVPTAIAGAGDWAEISGADRCIGAVHALGADISTFLLMGSFVARLRGRYAAGTRLGLAESVVAAGAGFLGGHMALNEARSGLLRVLCLVRGAEKTVGDGLQTRSRQLEPVDIVPCQRHHPIVPRGRSDDSGADSWTADRLRLGRARRRTRRSRGRPRR